MAWNGVPLWARRYVEWRLRTHRETVKMLEEWREDKIPSGTANYTPREGKGGAGSASTEAVALRIVNDEFFARAEKEARVIEHVLMRLPLYDLKLIELLYWRREYTITGAALEVGMSEATARRHVNKIIREIAEKIGILDRERS